MGSHPPKACSCAREWRVFLGGLVVALGLVGGVPPAVAQTAKASEKVQAKAAQIDRNGVLILVRGTLLALDQANKTGNYTVLRDLGSANFQGKSAAELAEIFANHRRQGLDFGAVAVLEPQLTMLPRIEPNGMLHMAGFFPSAPMQVNFELMFEPVNRQWKIFGVAVNLTPGGPQAPETPGAGSAKPVDATPPSAPSTAVGAPTKKSRPAKP